LKGYSNFEEIKVFYTVFEALIIEKNVLSASHFTDSSGNNDLVELENEDFGLRNINMVYDKNKKSFEMQFNDKYVTTDLRNAIKVAVKGYKTLALTHEMKQGLETYFSKYYTDYPELMI